MLIALLLLAEAFQLTPAASVYADAKGDPFKAPEGVACTAEGRVVVADSGNGRLLTFTFKDGVFAAGADLRFPELGHPTRLQIDSRGSLLSLDSRTRRIVRVNDGGGFGGFVEPKGVPPGDGFFPVAFKLDGSDAVYLLDASAPRVVVLDAAGAFVRQIPAPRGSTDVAVDARGTLYASVGQDPAVYSAAPGAAAFAPLTKSLRDSMSFASYLTTTEQGRLVLVDQHGNGLVVLAPDGSFLGRRLGIGWTEGLVYYPGQICIDARGDTFVADRGNNRVQAFTPAQ